MPLTAHAASLTDYPSFVRMHAELEIPDAVPSEESFVSRIAPAALFLREGEAVVGYASWQRFARVLHVRHVVVDRAARGRGVGRALMDGVAARGRALGCDRWYLHVKPDNVVARRLYERAGLTVRFVSRALEIDWAQTGALPRTDGVDVTTPAPERDAPLEARCRLLPGQVGVLRAQGYVLFVVSERGSEVGFAAFDPTFPGANPFRARDAGGARRLLEAMRPHALPVHDAVRIVIDDDAALVDAARAAGARPVMEVLRMEGTLT